ncbi:MAG: glutamate mutase L [Nitrososphaeria archaeon]
MQLEHGAQADIENLRLILATDVGSTTTKARLFKRMENGEYRFISSGEAPTTVEKPFEDVTVGLRNAVREIEELSGYKLLANSAETRILMPFDGKNMGVDLYVSTSSAGGGLQMIVAGVVKTMTTESSERAALGAGAIIMDSLSIDDGIPLHKKIEKLRFLRPDMILLAGGTDGGTKTHVLEMAEIIRAAEPKPRFGISYSLPVVFAGNKLAAPDVENMLKEKFFVKVTENLRPVLEVENVEPARNIIHEIFMEHVMSHAPGYEKLVKLVSVPVMPTPAGEGKMMRTIAESYGINVLGVGLGGATTNIYSVYDNKFVRSVSANLGMSYSIGNVLKSAGIKNIVRWLPFEISDDELYDRVGNKMIRPTTIPQTLEDLLIEHAIAREAIRLGFQHHKTLARELKGVHRERTISDVFEQEVKETYIDMKKIHMIIGTGGLLSHTPRRQQAALILIDAFQAEGIVKLTVDSAFMMPHLGVLSTVHPKAALDVLEKDCLVRLGTVIVFSGVSERGKIIGHVEVRTEDKSYGIDVKYGEIYCIPIGLGKRANIQAKPEGNFDVGAGKGKTVTANIEGGIVGIVVDGRGRPLVLPEKFEERKESLLEWFSALNAYPITGGERT